MDYKIYIVIILVLIILYYYTKKSNENFGTSYQGTLKLYYTNWCGWSKKFLPVWEELEKKAANGELSVKLQKIDCEKDKEMCQGIPGFPYIVLEKNTRKIDYKGNRQIDDVLTFLSKHH